MYKDKTKAREASKERMRKMREGVTSGTEGVTESEGVTAGVTRVRGQGVTKPMMVPEFARVLPEATVDTVKAVLYNRRVLGLSDDSEGRWQRAVTWYDWDKRGRPVNG